MMAVLIAIALIENFADPKPDVNEPTVRELPILTLRTPGALESALEGSKFLNELRLLVLAVFDARVVR